MRSSLLGVGKDIVCALHCFCACMVTCTIELNDGSHRAMSKVLEHCFGSRLVSSLVASSRRQLASFFLAVVRGGARADGDDYLTLLSISTSSPPSRLVVWDTFGSFQQNRYLQQCGAEWQAQGSRPVTMDLLAAAVSFVLSLVWPPAIFERPAQRRCVGSMKCNYIVDYLTCVTLPSPTFPMCGFSCLYRWWRWRR